MGQTVAWTHLGTGRLDSVEQDGSTKVAAEIDEVGALLDDGSAALALVPPDLGADLGVRADISRDGHHDGLARRLDDVLHGLDDLQVPEHVADRGDDPVLLEVRCEVERVLNRGCADGLLDEQRRLGEVLEDLDLQVGAGSVMWCPSASGRPTYPGWPHSHVRAVEGGRAADDDGVRQVLWLHPFDELVEVLAQPALGVGHGDE